MHYPASLHRLWLCHLDNRTLVLLQIPANSQNVMLLKPARIVSDSHQAVRIFSGEEKIMIQYYSSFFKRVLRTKRLFNSYFPSGNSQPIHY